MILLELNKLSNSENSISSFTFNCFNLIERERGIAIFFPPQNNKLKILLKMYKFLTKLESNLFQKGYQHPLVWSISINYQTIDKLIQIELGYREKPTATNTCRESSRLKNTVEAFQYLKLSFKLQQVQYFKRSISMINFQNVSMSWNSILYLCYFAKKLYIIIFIIIIY